MKKLENFSWIYYIKLCVYFIYCVCIFVIIPNSITKIFIGIIGTSGMSIKTDKIMIIHNNK